MLFSQTNRQVMIVSVEKIPKGENVPLDTPLETFKICKKLEKICRDHDGIGLSAVQVGYPLKLFIMLVNHGKYKSFRFFANCEYLPVGEQKIPNSLEGCLSLTKRYFEVKDHRYEKIK